MAGAEVVEAVAGGLLVFFVPGYAVTRATFPEWRLGGPTTVLRLLEIVALSFVLSVVLTVVVGALLLAVGPSGFAATWSNPVLESGLAAIALVAFVAGWVRGAYGAPGARAAAPATAADESGAWELDRELDRLAREERRLAHALRVRATGSADDHRLRAELDAIRLRRDELVRRREAEYATP
jgi:uncharacterized membrane protein